jgi:hypothetical protein
MASETQSSTTAEKGARDLDEITLQRKYEQLQERYVKLLEDKIEVPALNCRWKTDI